MSVAQWKGVNSGMEPYPLASYILQSSVLSGLPNYFILNNKITVVSNEMGMYLENLLYQKTIFCLSHGKLLKKSYWLMTQESLFHRCKGSSMSENLLILI